MPSNQRPPNSSRRRRAARVAACWLALASAVAAVSPAADPPPTTPARDLNTMDVRELVTEFHNSMELARSHSQRRVDLVNALRRAGPPLIDAMRADLAAGDAAVRVRALRVLAAVGNKARPLVPEVVAAAADDDPGVRAAAVPVLCHLRDPRGFDALLRAARDPDPRVRGDVVRNGKAALADAPFALAVTALGDPDLHVRVAAVGALMWSKDKRAAAYLVPLLDDPTVLHHDVRNGVKIARRVCDEAAAALEMVVDNVYQLPGDKIQVDYDALVQKWRDWWRDTGRKLDDALYDEPEVKRADR